MLIHHGGSTISVVTKLIAPRHCEDSLSLVSARHSSISPPSLKQLLVCTHPSHILSFLFYASSIRCVWVTLGFISPFKQTVWKSAWVSCPSENTSPAQHHCCGVRATLPKRQTQPTLTHNKMELSWFSFNKHGSGIDPVQNPSEKHILLRPLKKRWHISPVTSLNPVFSSVCTIK